MEKFSSKMLIISVLSVFSLAALLLFFEKISVTVFVAFVALYLVVAFFLYKKDEIDEIKTKWFEMRTLRREIYAKVEELEKLERRAVETEKEVSNIKIEIQELSRQLIRLISFSILVAAMPPPTPKDLKDKLNLEIAILLDKSFDDKEHRQKFAKKLAKDIEDA